MHKYKKRGQKGRSGVRHIPSTNNIFKDLGFDDEEAESLLLRTDLMIAIERVIRKNAWTQTQAARKLGVAQSRVSDLIRGRIEKFSVDMLMSWLNKLGWHVRVTLEPKKKAA